MGTIECCQEGLYHVGMKRCSRCKEEKDEGEFQRNRSSRDGLQDQCKACRRETDRRTYAKQSEEQKARYREANLRTIERNRRLLYEYLLGHPCVDCDESDPVVLELDHIAEKKGNIANLIRSGRGWQSIYREIQKCEVRCANCHRKITARRSGTCKKLIWSLEENRPT